MMNNCKYLILFVLFCLFACQERPQQPVQVTKQDMKSSMETANRYMTNEEQEEIDRYVQRHGLEMVATGTGLRYQILKQGSDCLIESGQTVSLVYELSSLRGEMFYSSENDGLKTFKVGDGSVETGLDEAMTHLHYGDVAKVIIPFHLAYGLHGDDRGIPGYATLVYTIKIIDNQ